MRSMRDMTGCFVFPEVPFSPLVSKGVSVAHLKRFGMVLFPGRSRALKYLSNSLVEHLKFGQALMPGVESSSLPREVALNLPISNDAPALWRWGPHVVIVSLVSVRNQEWTPFYPQNYLLLEKVWLKWGLKPPYRHYCKPVCHSQMAALHPVRHFDLLATAPCDRSSPFWNVRSRAF